MLSVISKGHIPLIDETDRDRIQEFLSGTHPLSPRRKTYDSGTTRQTTAIPASGRDEIVHEDGDVDSHKDVGSGYNKGLDPGGQADDETGPGNTSEKRETNPNIIHQMFMTQDDISNFLFQNQESSKRDQKSRSQLFNIFQGQSYGPTPRSQSWQHTY